MAPKTGTRVENDYLRTADVAALLHVSPKTVARWAKENRLPFVKTLGGHRRFPASAIRDLADRLKSEDIELPE
ncbi:MAG: helix-turn-helix domain-containing protein [Actinomycetota bacterium]